MQTCKMCIKYRTSVGRAIRRDFTCALLDLPGKFIYAYRLTCGYSGGKAAGLMRN